MIVIHKSTKYVTYLNKKTIKQNGYINSKFYSNKCGTFIVLENVKKDIFKIKFDMTGEMYFVRRTNIISGEIKDYMYPSICNIACLGREVKILRNNDSELFESMLSRYYSIIKRCYDVNNNSYKRYGELGVRVSNDWLNFSNFYNDIINLPRFNRDKFISGELFIDKDKKQMNLNINERVYSKETVTLLSRKENNLYRDNDAMGDKHSKYFISIYNGIEVLEKNISKFARNNNISIKTVRNILYGLTKPNKINFRYPTKIEMIKIDSGELVSGDILSNNKRFNDYPREGSEILQ